MKRAPRLVVVGSSNTDMIVRTPRIPSPGETVLGREFLMVGGGKGANQAVAGARLGADVTLVARVGDDAFGAERLEELLAFGVHTGFVQRESGCPSGVALITVDDSGENVIVVAPGANARVSPSDIDDAEPAFAEADVVMAQLEVPMETVQYALRRAKELGRTTVLNPAPAAKLSATILAFVDVLVPNEVEAAMLLELNPHARHDPEAMAQSLLRMGPKSVVITLGSKGCVAVSHDRTQHIAGRSVEAIDATAAGDCFCGALATVLAEGHELGAAVRFANAAAALSVTRLGAQSSLPTRAEVDAFIHR